MVFFFVCRSRLPGFRDSLEDDTLAVTFNVIVPIQYWGFDDKSKVRLRFGPSQLGSWSNDAGNFTIKRLANFICSKM